MGRCPRAIALVRGALDAHRRQALPSTGSPSIRCREVKQFSSHVALIPRPPTIEGAAALRYVPSGEGLSAANPKTADVAGEFQHVEFAATLYFAGA